MSLLAQIRALPAALLALKDTQAIADALPPVVTVGTVSRADFTIWAATTGMRATIEDHATDPASPLRSIALSCRDLIQGAAPGIDFTNPANVAMLQKWVEAGELSAPEADALKAKGSTSVPVSEYAVRCACWADNGDWLV